MLSLRVCASEFVVDFFLVILKACLGLVSVLLTLSPVLITLTKTYSEDTIWALAISLSAVHLAMFDYSYVAGVTAE